MLQFGLSSLLARAAATAPPIPTAVPPVHRWFYHGACWMALAGGRTYRGTPLQAGLYGWGKYIACVTGAVLAGYGLSQWHWTGWLVALPVFYLLEVHLLFLFPCLIMGRRYPVCSSIRLVYRFGYWRAFLITIRLAAYMLLGLLNRSQPLQAWYTACATIWKMS